MRVVLILFLALILASGPACASGAAAGTDGDPQEQAAAAEGRKLIASDTPALMAIIERYLKDHAGEKDSLSVSKLHLALARYYIHLHHADKAKEQLKQVTAIDSELDQQFDIFSPYIGMILEDAASKHPDEVLSAVQSSQDILDWIRTIKHLNPPAGNREPDMAFVNNKLCGAAAAGLAKNRAFESLDRLPTLPQCSDSAPDVARLHLAALLLNGEYAKAYDFVVSRNEKKPPAFNADPHGWRDNLSYSVFIGCLRVANTPLVSEADRAYLLREAQAQMRHPEDNKAPFLAMLLRRAGEKDAAFELAKKISDATLRDDALRASYNDFYRSGNREKFLEAAQALDVVDAPPASGAPNTWPPVQWYAQPIAEVEVLKEKPTPLAYELVMRMKNDRTRFTGLLALYRAAKEKDIAMPGCAARTVDCVIVELLKIADRHQDEAARDFMYGRIVELQQAAGENDAAAKTYEKIKHPDEFTCYYDSCQMQVVASPGPAAAECAKQPENLQGVPCRYASGAYLRDLESADFTPANRDAYIKELLPLLERDGKYPQLLAAAEKMSDPRQAEELVFRTWQRVMRVYLDRHENHDSGRFKARREFMDALFANSFFAKRDALWDRIITGVEFAYWNGFYLGVDMPPQERRADTQEVWALAKWIREKHPGIRPGDCSPARLGHFDNECEVRRLIAQGEEQSALQLAARDPSGLALPMAANVILNERFGAENLNYRLTSKWRYGLGAIANGLYDFCAPEN